MDGAPRPASSSGSTRTTDELLTPPSTSPPGAAVARSTRMGWMRPFTMRFVNPITRLVAGRLPMFALLTITGRRTGRRYRIPMNVFRAGERWVFALTYGPDVQWVRNVMAVGSCDMVTRNRLHELIDPELIVDRSGRLMPQPVRLFLRLLRVDAYLTMDEASIRLS